MALRSTLETIVEMTRQEARRSTNSSRGIDNLDYIKRVIKRHYQILAESYDWKHLALLRDDAGKDIQAGSRYYNWPTQLDIERPFKVWTWDSSTWITLVQGITPSEYNIYDSDADVRVDPPERWEWYDYDQFEIWPLPGVNVTDGLRFTGTRKPNPLTTDDAQADMDDVLLSLYSSATLLLDAEQKDAATERLAAAQARLGHMKASKGDSSRVVIGGVDPNMSGQGRMPRHAEYIR